MDAPLNEREDPPRAPGKYLKLLLGWSLLLIVTSVQVVATSYLSYYFLKAQLLQNVIEHPTKYSVDQLRRSVKKCVTHWTGSSRSNQSSNDGNVILAWETNIGQVFTGNCTEYKEKSLEIKKTGIYFIYVQVMFHKDGNNVKFVFNFNGEEKTLNSRKATEIASNTVYFGSTYKLRNGTKIFVKSNPKHILFGESETFIGLFEL